MVEHLNAVEDGLLFLGITSVRMRSVENGGLYLLIKKLLQTEGSETRRVDGFRQGAISLGQQSLNPPRLILFGQNLFLKSMPCLVQ